MQAFNRGSSFLAIVILLPVLAFAADGGPLPGIKKDCATCHQDIARGPALRKPLSSLCLECHPGRTSPAEHKVDLVPVMPAGKLPLQDGKMTCVTCHDPHQNSNGKLLRIRAKDLCQQCHKV